MSTSSIFTTVKITTKEEAERFLAALEAAEKAIKVEKSVTPNMRLVSDLKEIRQMLEKRKKRIEENPDMYGISIKEMLEGNEPI